MTLTEEETSILHLDTDRIGIIHPGMERYHQLDSEWDQVYSEISSCFDYYLQGDDVRGLPLGNQFLEITKQQLGDYSKTIA